MPDRLRAYRTLRYIDARTVRELREVVFEDACLSRAEADALLGLAERVPDGDPSWLAFYEEVRAAQDAPRAEEPALRRALGVAGTHG